MTPEEVLDKYPTTADLLALYGLEAAIIHYSKLVDAQANREGNG